eukprot:1343356-Rhodomonas_salina.4
MYNGEWEWMYGPAALTNRRWPVEDKYAAVDFCWATDDQITQLGLFKAGWTRNVWEMMWCAWNVWNAWWVWWVDGEWGSMVACLRSVCATHTLLDDGRVGDDGRVSVACGLWPVVCVVVCGRWSVVCLVLEMVCGVERVYSRAPSTELGLLTMMIIITWYAAEIENLDKDGDGEPSVHEILTTFMYYNPTVRLPFSRSVAASYGCPSCHLWSSAVMLCTTAVISGGGVAIYGDLAAICW